MSVLLTLYRGILILSSIALASPISAFSTALGSGTGVLVACLMGAPPQEIEAGLWSYDAALIGCAIGGIFYV
jgi:urea transporter